MPMENTGSGAGNTKLLRLLRLPRLWRLVKLVRLLRMSKVLKNSKQLEKFKEALNLNEGVQGLLNIFMTVFLLNHIASCFLKHFYLKLKLDVHMTRLCWCQRQRRR